MLADYVTVLGPYHNVRPHDPYSYLLAVTHFAYIIWIISKRVLPTQFLRNARKGRLEIIK